MRVGIASDHGGFSLKQQLADALRSSGYEVVDFGANQFNPADDYPDFIIPLARAVVTVTAIKSVEESLKMGGPDQPPPRRPPPLYGVEYLIQPARSVA
jgi:hypothetical protein